MNIHSYQEFLAKLSTLNVQTCALFNRQQKWGLNTYLYAPKDDYKHRMFWRELYSVEEAGDYFIFIWGLSVLCLNRIHSLML